MSTVAYSIGKSKRCNHFILSKSDPKPMLQKIQRENKITVLQQDQVLTRSPYSIRKQNQSGRKYKSRRFNQDYRMGSRTLIGLNKSIGPGPTAYDMP